MNLVLHIFKKDVRHLRGLLAACPNYPRLPQRRVG